MNIKGIHLIRLQEESKMMFRTWNHLAWRRAARASRHFCLSKTSAGSFTILEVTSKNGSNCQMVVRNGCLTRSERLPRTHCHTYQSVPDHQSLSKCTKRKKEKEKKPVYAFHISPHMQNLSDLFNNIMDQLPLGALLFSL